MKSGLDAMPLFPLDDLLSLKGLSLKGKTTTTLLFVHLIQEKLV